MPAVKKSHTNRSRTKFSVSGQTLNSAIHIFSASIALVQSMFSKIIMQIYNPQRHENRITIVSVKVGLALLDPCFQTSLDGDFLCYEMNGPSLPPYIE